MLKLDYGFYGYKNEVYIEISVPVYGSVLYRDCATVQNNGVKRVLR